MEGNTIEVDIKVPNKTRYLSLIGKIGEDIARELERYSGDKEVLAYHLNLVLTEAMVNAIKHAGPKEPEKLVRIVITLHMDDLTIRVYDDGQGFDINSIPAPNFEELEDRGRGIFLIRTLMDSVCYRKNCKENILEMKKKLS
ncbi:MULTISPECIES: ATP-binding protein [Citrifermentans]|uniref:Anti-sigma factor, protein serine/threonine kinase n=2 Tax=Geobacteraceae TaxID=213422 RepID=B5EHC2_CITBB|nr:MULTISPECIES: ATP-binding protein [Citrifermentans]ACH39658.1 anti-sigma factor, protein serine/threonine kinase [Citrifermentans bemidjiense Bem]